MGWRSRAAVLCWALALLATAVVAARTHFVADLSAFLPSRPTPEQALLLDQIGSGSAARLLLIGIEGGQSAQRAEASTRLALALRGNGDFDSVLNGEHTAWRDAGEIYFAHRYLLSPAISAEHFTSRGLHEAMADTLALLGTPAGTLIKPTLLQDPTGEALRLLEALTSGTGPRQEDGVWVSRTAPRAVLAATVRGDGADLDAQERAIAGVRESFAALHQPDLRLLVTGPGSFGVSSRATIKSEVERLAWAGTLVMVLLLWSALGSLRSLAIALLPVVSGVLAGIAAVSLGFGQVHGITLGFGTTLIGEAVDYAIYYLVQARPLTTTERGAAPGHGDSTVLQENACPAPGGALAQRWIRLNWPTVRLGLWTSVCGFAALLFSGFGGLAQLGAFSIAGLIAAALTTRFVLPHLAPQGAEGLGVRPSLGRFAAAAVRTLSHPGAGLAAGALTLAATAALWWLPSPWHAELSSLSPITPAELRLDAELRADLGTAEAGTLVVISAPSEAQALEGAEAAGRQLDELVRRGALLGYDSAARLLPSPSLQLERQAALPDRATLLKRLAEATTQGPLKAERLGAFVDDVQAARSQPLLTRAALQASAAATALDALLVPASGTRPWRAMISVHSGPGGADPAALRQTLAGVPQAQVLDIKSELDNMVQGYLREAAWQAGLGVLAVLVLLALHLRSWKRVWRLCPPIAAAVVMVLAALTSSGVPLGILHLVGLLLVVAIGSNYALFFDHLRQLGHADLDTLASLLLANLTTVLSFGLLATSSLTALHAIGQVVAPGALLCLLLSAVFIHPRHNPG